MHIPDAFMPLPQAAVYWLLAIIFIALALKWARKELNEDKIPLVAVLAAGIFAIQAFNLPVGMGTSGHLVGGALAAIVLGSPYAAVFILTIVLIIQGVIFGDGGITTMGANIINMGVIGGFVGYYSFQGLKSVTKNVYISAGIAAWLACFIAALACAIEMAIAGTFPLIAGMTAMGIYHAAIGVIEGIITAVAIYLIHNVRPDLLSFDTKSGTEAPA
ncbi:cobalt transporter CbiM [Methanolacinia petrolearia]|uniref:cobalt transporter CbiM n=1 Tax=Methanolacinia petrolearia TaxID=54120 RepID=UPI003BA886E0